ncbi:tyrosinase family protein [Flavobacterium sp.]|uniref:tyrosinase family protein n=1 Tax=Flavobacterium sp. TaxID=239 RepID=UPI0040477EAF
MARKNLNSLTSAERQQLVNLMLNYINDRIVDDHMQIVHSGAQLFEGHRSYLGKMETWLTQNGGSQFSPLPVWDPATQIPQEFNIVKPKDNGTSSPALVNLDPKRNLPAAFKNPELCSFSNAPELGNGIRGWHDGVHLTVRGTMGNAMIAPYAPIFWCWHAFLDNVYSIWQTCPSPGANKNFASINFNVLSETTNLPSGKVSETLFQEGFEWSEKNTPNLL